MLIISKSFRFGALSLILLFSLYIYIFAIDNICLGEWCDRAYADEEEIILHQDDGGTHKWNIEIVPERYNDPEYLQDLETVQKEVNRRENIDRQKELEFQESLERATQKAIELREKNSN